MASDKKDKELIVKKTVYAGTESATFKNNTKIHFHFRARLCDESKTLLDDSRKLGEGKPLDLVLGKKFKLEVWEAVLQMMAVNEIAEFTVDKSLVTQYPFVSKTLRDAHKPKGQRRSAHCCAMTLQNEGVGYDDLNDLLKDPKDIEFTMEILKVEQPEQYEKESWQLEEAEKLALIPELKRRGNELYKSGGWREASDLYAKAVGLLDQLMLKEKPHDEEWNELNGKRTPLLLNYAQCKLIEGDYYAVIEHCGEALKTDADNVKALFRRAKAHVGAWNPAEAKRDFERALELDPGLKAAVGKEVRELERLVEAKDREDRGKFRNLFA